MIWKFPLKATDKQTIEMPGIARVLCVQVQNGTPCLWADGCHEDALQVARTFSTYGTGHPMPKKPGRYIGTFQVERGTLIFHVYED